MNKKIIGIIWFIVVLLLVAILIFSYINRKNNPEVSDVTGSATPDIATISYDGVFKAKGVVVRPEKETLTIMPIEASTEYRAEEFFYYETENNLILKQKQEVLITFHYRQNANDSNIHEAVINNIEVLKDESSIQIPSDIYVKAYSSKDNISISINKAKSNNKKIQFIITDKNDLKYNYSTMKYALKKYNPPPTKTEVTYTEDGGMSISGYNPWPEMPKMIDSSNEFNYTIDENGKVYVNIDWSKVYGELKEGQYIFSLSTVLNPRVSILNSNVIDYPYDDVIINIEFNINSNGEFSVNDTKII